MDKAVALATERNAYGFFYQEHTNGYQIVGLFNSREDMAGDWTSEGNYLRGALASLDDIRDERQLLFDQVEYKRVMAQNDKLFGSK